MSFNHTFTRIMLSCCMLLMALIPSVQLAAQNQGGKCTVHVVDEAGQPLLGAAVVLKGTNNGHAVDFEGACVFTSLPDDAILVATCLGYEDASAVVGGRSDLTITMKTSNLMMDELVVVGYGTMRKRDLSGAVAQVKGETINEYSTLSAANALQGRVSGVQVNQVSGQPGAGINIRIRGANSIKGNNEPLWIINGFPGDINMINNSDIESIEILKDASATAIYGSRGANGVVIVTTKSAREGEVKVEYNGSVGVQSVIKKMEMMDAWQFMTYLNEKAAINNQPVAYDEDQIAAVTKSTNWQDLIFRNAMINDHSLSVTGGNSKIQTSTGLSFFQQDGIIKNSGYRRISIRSDVKYNISKYVQANANVIFSRSDRDQLSAGTVLDGAMSASPLAEPKYEDGRWNDFINEPTAGTNAVAYMEEVQNKWYSNRLMANAGLTIKPIDGLSIQVSANVLNKDNRNDVYTPTSYKENYVGEATISATNTLDITSNNIITYDKQLGKHHLNVMGGMTYEQSVTKTFSTGTASGFMSDVTGVHDINSAETKGIPTSSYSDWKLMSFLGRINYNYDDRYLLTVNMRADGSSRYSKGSKWGYFPSAAVAWRIKQESFLRDVNWISELKLRAGYGVTGSTAIEPYSTLNLLDTHNVVFGDDLYVAYTPQDSYLAQLMWEQTAQTDLGLDLAFFNHRLKLTADVYHKKTTNLLNNVEMPRSSGYTTALMNIGELSNRGFELQVDGRIFDGEVKWDLGANISMNRSRVDKLSEGKDIFGSTVSAPSGLVSGQLNIIREGEEMCMFYGWVEDGYDETGRIVYKDIDGVEGITDADRTIIGNPNPDLLYGFNTSVSWKGFTLSAFFQGVYGNDIYGMSMATYAYRYNYNANATADILGNYWTPENPNAKYPNLYQDINLKMSDRFVYDGSYLRCRNITLAYDIPCGKGKFISKARVYVSGQNLFTITKYPFWDPDVNSKGSGTSITQGVDATSYPSPRTYSIGCKITF